MGNVRFKKSQLSEFINKDMTMINKRVPSNAKIQSTVQNSTTDDHVDTARQQMVWMQYRRYYGENDNLPYNKEADKWANSPKKFYEFLKKKGEEDQFDKYFIKDERRAQKIKNKIADKDKEISESYFTKKSPNSDVYSKNQIREINDLKNDYPILYRNIEGFMEMLNKVENANDKASFVNYMLENLDLRELSNDLKRDIIRKIK